MPKPAVHSAPEYVVGTAAVGQPVVLPAAATPSVAGAPGPRGAPSPQWDAARNTYVQWDPTTGRYLTWDPTSQTWQ